MPAYVGFGSLSLLCQRTGASHSIEHHILVYAVPLLEGSDSTVTPENFLQYRLSPS